MKWHVVVDEEHWVSVPVIYHTSAPGTNVKHYLTLCCQPCCEYLLFSVLPTWEQNFNEDTFMFLLFVLHQHRLPGSHWEHIPVKYTISEFMLIEPEDHLTSPMCSNIWGIMDWTSIKIKNTDDLVLSPSVVLHQNSTSLSSRLVLFTSTSPDVCQMSFYIPTL